MPSVAGPGARPRCSVDADGVPAQWVETTVATPGQATFVMFVADFDELIVRRQLAWSLATTTGARVFVVGCRTGASQCERDMVDDGVTAYAWLLNEGLDLATTTFVMSSTEATLARAVLQAAKARGLPVPQAPARIAQRPGPRACHPPVPSRNAAE